MADYTLATITSEIASNLKKELDEPFKRILADKVDAWRSTLLRRTLKENPQERVHFRQTIYVLLEEVNPIPECVDANSPVCSVMRSTLPLPTAVRAGGIQYDYVGSGDGNNAFQRKLPGTGYIMRQGKYSKNKVLWDEVNKNLEIDGAPGIPFVRVDGVFDKPEQVAKFNCSSVGRGCDYWNEPYPVSGDIKQAIVECILKVDYQQGVTPSNKEIEVTPIKQEHAPDGR